MSIPDSINSNFLASGKQPKGVIVLTVVLFLSFLWAFVAYWAVSSRAEILQGTEQVLRRMDHAVGEQTRRQFAMIGVFLGVADQWITDNPGADPRSDRRFLRLVENFRERTDRAIDIQLASEAGQVFPLLAKAAAPPPALAIGDTDYFRFAMGGDSGRFFIGAPQVSSASGTWGIPVAQRLTHPQKGVAAVVASVELSALLALYEEERIRPNGAIVLVRRDGTLLARAPHDERLIGKSLVGGQLYREFLPRAERGFAKLDRTATDAMEKYVAYSVLSDFPLVTVVSTAAGDVFEAWRRQMLVIALLGVGVSIFALLAAWRLTRVLHELSVRTAELQHLATTDLMTGINNRHHFLSLLYHEFARGRRYKAPLSLMVLDLDFFKQINDGYGHAAGDAALKMFASAATDCLRGMDVIGRLGGEEFGILLPSTAVDQAEAVAERIRVAVAKIAIDTDLGTVRFTTSIGVAQSQEEDESVDVLLARADAALYAAKAAGRNRVVVRAS
ncbi:MAG: GGDEF domain-containing protein [Betaproteobacteria bacterium]|uniref:diguanylate cyclase n=1 Tax=Candidatus Proximibacter danicus TaxID=2954365 RepID=A0A9D7K077_9PROT|nr:GGDEF domain-containing protein [Candidatus Proximibacter danicus]